MLLITRIAQFMKGWLTGRTVTTVHQKHALPANSVHNIVILYHMSEADTQLTQVVGGHWGVIPAYRRCNLG